MTIRRRHLLAVPLALGAPALVRASEPTELSFWSWRQEDRAFYQRTIAAFRAKHPDINVKFEAFEPTQYPTILSTALAGGTGPDLMQVKAYGGLATLAAPGYLLPLDRQAVPELANFPQDALAAESFKGTAYALPFAVQTMLVIYNTEIFAKYSLAAPESWDDLITICRTLKSNGVIPFANGTATAWQNETLTFSLLASEIGPAFVADVEAGRADFADPRFVNALQMLDGMRDYLAPNFTGVDYAASQQLFVAGRAAMFAGGSFEIANFRRQNPKLKLDVFASPPASRGSQAYVATYADGGYAVNAKSQKRDAALQFLRYLGSPEFGTEFANALDNVSPIHGVQIKDPLLRKVAQMDEHAIPYLMLVDFRYHEPSGSVLLQAGVQKMLAGKATPAEVGQEITKGISTYTVFRK